MTGLAAATRREALVGAGVALMALTANAAAPVIDALSELEKGRWQVRELQGEIPPSSLCLRNPTTLLLYAHRGEPGCSSEVLEAGADAVTVQYSCRARGFGHSRLRIETPRSVRVDTQGFRNGRPFAYRLEARRTGAC